MAPAGLRGTSLRPWTPHGLPALLALLCTACLCSSSSAAAAGFSYSALLANTTTLPLELLEDPFAAPGADRALLEDGGSQWDEWKRIGRYSQIANPMMPGGCAGRALRVHLLMVHVMGPG